ncbi:MAG: SURF1 family protein [Woeseiaceae bacterium]|nr:SURF1 family protein [Woeseiaceae bacterium]
MNLDLDGLIDNEQFRRFFLPLATLFLTGLFLSLGLWQLDRAAQKNRLQQMFESNVYLELRPGMPVVEFQNLETEGRYLSERQVIVDRIILDDRLGYYVLTPLRYAENEPLLIVNRGWIARSNASGSKPQVEVAGTMRKVRGRMGFLPKVGIRSGEAFTANDDWPKLASYPTPDELSRALGAAVLPFVLLLDPDDEDGFIRRWQPAERGPMMHYGYAAQWFAMAAAVAGIFVWKRRKTAV